MYTYDRYLPSFKCIFRLEDSHSVEEKGGRSQPSDKPTSHGQCAQPSRVAPSTSDASVSSISPSSIFTRYSQPPGNENHTSRLSPHLTTPSQTHHNPQRLNGDFNVQDMELEDQRQYNISGIPLQSCDPRTRLSRNSRSPLHNIRKETSMSLSELDSMSTRYHPSIASRAESSALSDELSLDEFEPRQSSRNTQSPDMRATPSSGYQSQSQLHQVVHQMAPSDSIILVHYLCLISKLMISYQSQCSSVWSRHQPYKHSRHDTDSSAPPPSLSGLSLVHLPQVGYLLLPQQGTHSNSQLHQVVHQMAPSDSIILVHYLYLISKLMISYQSQCSSVWSRHQPYKRSRHDTDSSAPPPSLSGLSLVHLPQVGYLLLPQQGTHSNSQLHQVVHQMAPSDSIILVHYLYLISKLMISYQSQCSSVWSRHQPYKRSRHDTDSSAPPPSLSGLSLVHLPQVGYLLLPQQGTHSNSQFHQVVHQMAPSDSIILVDYLFLISKLMISYQSQYSSVWSRHQPYKRSRHDTDSSAPPPSLSRLSPVHFPQVGYSLPTQQGTDTDSSSTLPTISRVGPVHFPQVGYSLPTQQGTDTDSSSTLPTISRVSPVHFPQVGYSLPTQQGTDTDSSSTLPTISRVSPVHFPQVGYSLPTQQGTDTDSSSTLPTITQSDGQTRSHEHLQPSVTENHRFKTELRTVVPNELLSPHHCLTDPSRLVEGHPRGIGGRGMLPSSRYPDF